MNKSSSPPPYKPPPEIQAAIEKQRLLLEQNSSGPRRNIRQVPKRNWIHRNPLLFQFCFVTTSLLILFSRPLYDAFIATPPPPPAVKVPPHKR